MNKNIVLVYPKPYLDKGTSASNTTYFPMSLIYLAGVSRKICDDISIFDFSLEGNDINCFEKTLSNKLPGVVGINCFFSMLIKKVLFLAEFVKNKFPETRVVIGGLHPTIYAEQIMQNCGSIDAVVLGEGDDAFPRLLKFYFSGAAPAGPTVRL
ncbi:MAG: cobalamin-dependent protein, partial [Spirochaetaceae bacterium]|nr:cobalamin-dependent protein [Spirochaetaceae bacterium]